MKNKYRWEIILICICIAGIWWLFNALRKTYVTEINYPISFTLDTTKVMAVEELPHEIVLEVTGSGWNLVRYIYARKSDPIEISLSNPLKTKFIGKKQLYQLATEKLSKLTVNKVITDKLSLHIKPKTGK
ncbi:MAG: hypothetical protein MI674_06990 [Cytophagales bacterium]|nr:hypothetical protein [Cytophagales bacterium]